MSSWHRSIPKLFEGRAELTGVICRAIGDSPKRECSGEDAHAPSDDGLLRHRDAAELAPCPREMQVISVDASFERCTDSSRCHKDLESDLSVLKAHCYSLLDCYKTIEVIGALW